jgi:hypothetical protein
MIARFGKVIEQYYNNEFVDVNARHWVAPILAGAYRAGLLQYLKNEPFKPNQKLTRAEAVEMLYRTAPVTDLIEELVDFNKGYPIEFK